MTGPTHGDSPPPSTNRQRRREKLRRENQWVRSTGMISKHVMAIAFGAVVLAAGIAVAAASPQWPLGLLLGAVGLSAIAWGVYAWSRAGHRASREH
jgi:hypothetical protein